MANLNFWLSHSAHHHDAIPVISSDLDRFVGEQWHPFHESIVSDLLTSTLTKHFPVEANPRSIQCFTTKSYFDDYYNRIHIAPSTLALGNIASEQSQSVLVWNAYLGPKTLLGIENIPEGINVSGQNTPPFNFTALQELTWDISISPDGPSTIVTTLVWRFNAEQADLRITGNRIIAFGFLVDWSKPVNESLQWLTNILQSSSGHEQRRSLRLAPRISYEADLLLHEQERQYFELIVVGWFDRTFAIPVWNHQLWLKTAHAAGGLVIYCDTTHREFKPNRLAILRGETAFENETVEVESVLADRLILKRPLIRNWSAGTCLSPALTAQLETAPQLIKRTDRMMRTRVVFNVVEQVDYQQSPLATTYRTYPVLTEKPNESNDLTHSHERLFQTLDNNTARFLKVDTAKAAFQLYQYAWMTFGRQQQASLKNLFYSLRGSQKAIWIPTFSDDLTVTSNSVSTANSLTVKWCGYTRFALNELGKKDIRIELKNGQILHRRIVAAAEISTTEEQIELDQNFDNVNKDTVISISFMSLCRLSSDTVNIEHINDSDGTAKCAVTWRGVRES
ncbi:MAG: hypothetical protein KAZ18_00340 [Acinetobacter sp.]|nr:hypothetical protein [Acinetobacter sp.]